MQQDEVKGKEKTLLNNSFLITTIFEIRTIECHLDGLKRKTDREIESPFSMCTKIIHTVDIF